MGYKFRKWVLYYGLSYMRVGFTENFIENKVIQTAPPVTYTTKAYDYQMSVPQEVAYKMDINDCLFLLPGAGAELQII
jgi:hypothetical protein